MRTAVINNGGLFWGQLPHTKPDTTSGNRQLSHGRVVTLVPGFNFVDSAELAKLRENPAVEVKFTDVVRWTGAPEQDPTRVNRPLLEVDRSIGKNGEVEDACPLASLNAAQCQSVATQTLSEELLRAWMAEETRPEVRGILQKRLDVLAGKGGEELSASSAAARKPAPAKK